VQDAVVNEARGERCKSGEGSFKRTAVGSTRSSVPGGRSDDEHGDSVCGAMVQEISRSLSREETQTWDMEWRGWQTAADEHLSLASQASMILIPPFP
jgi:hypothetical protein